MTERLIFDDERRFTGMTNASAMKDGDAKRLFEGVEIGKDLEKRFTFGSPFNPLKSSGIL